MITVVRYMRAFSENELTARARYLPDSAALSKFRKRRLLVTVNDVDPGNYASESKLRQGDRKPIYFVSITFYFGWACESAGILHLHYRVLNWLRNSRAFDDRPRIPNSVGGHFRVIGSRSVVINNRPMQRVQRPSQ